MNITSILTYIGVVQQTPAGSAPAKTSAPQAPAPAPASSTPTFSCTPVKTPPKEILEVVDPKQFQLCVPADGKGVLPTVDLDPVNTVMLPGPQIGLPDGRTGNWVNFLIGKGIGVWKLDSVSWETAAEFIYPPGTDFKQAGIALQAANSLYDKDGNAVFVPSRPYDLLPDANGASYRYLRMATGNSFLGFFSCPLPNFGSIPTIAGIKVAPLSIVDKCSDLNAPLAGLKADLEALDAKLAEVRGIVYKEYSDQKKIREKVDTYLVLKKGVLNENPELVDDDTAENATNFVLAAKAQAIAAIQSVDQIKGKGCTDMGTSISDLGMQRNKIQELTANLNSKALPKANPNGAYKPDNQYKPHTGGTHGGNNIKTQPPAPQKTKKFKPET